MSRTLLQQEKDEALVALARRCLYEKCRRSLEGRRADARWCSVACRTYYTRIQRRLARIHAHPRCVVCNDPIRFGQPGVNLWQVTCGRIQCRRTRLRWFGPLPTKVPAERRSEIARRAAMVRWGSHSVEKIIHADRRWPR